MGNISFFKKYGDTALITGAAHGLGMEFSIQCASLGLSLVLIDIDGQSLEESALNIRKIYSVTVDTFTGDLSDSRFVDRIIASPEFIKTSLLINNAGLSSVGLFHSLEPGFLEQQVDVNVIAPLRLTRALTPHLIERKRGGDNYDFFGICQLWNCFSRKLCRNKSLEPNFW